MSREPSDKKLGILLYGAVAVFVVILVIAFAVYVRTDRDPGSKPSAPPTQTAP